MRGDAVKRGWEHGRNLVVFEVEERHGWIGEGVVWWEGKGRRCNIPQICGGMLINKIVVLKIFDELFG
jgi:hypothetical protein